MNSNIEFAVVVVSYNSSKTIISTLESIKKQTVKPIELIISDDGSTDDTCEIIRQWIKDNHYCIEIIELVTAESNTGIAGNANRGVDAVLNDSVWIKLIAADDILTPKCLEYYKDYIKHNPDARAIYAAIHSFKDESELIGWNDVEENDIPIHRLLSNQNVSVQKKYFDYFGQFTMSPTGCIHKSIFDNVRFDERIPMIEDVPFNRNLLYNDIKLHYCPRSTVLYRIGNSVSHQTSRFFNPIFIESCKLYGKYYKPIYDNSLISKLVEFGSTLSKKRRDFFYVKCNNKPTPFTMWLFKVTGMILGKYNNLLIKMFFVKYHIK